MSQHDPVRLYRLSAWALLLAWLFFGSLVLAEQVVPELEPTQQTQGYDHDEEALVALEYALKPIPTTLDDTSSPSSTSLGLQPALISPINALRPGLRRPVLSIHSGLSLHKQLSTYRI